MWILGFLLLFLSVPGLQGQTAAPVTAENVQLPPPQPLPFNHKVHVSLGLECLSCHPIEGPGIKAGLPAETQCMLCHASIKKDSPAIQKLATHQSSGKPLPWTRIYTVPSYVWFSHQSHHQATGLDCELCHEKVAERDVLVKEKPTSMEFCMDCHAERVAPTGCDFCHGNAE